MLAAVQSVLGDLHDRDLIALIVDPAQVRGEGPSDAVFHITFLQHTVEVRTDDSVVAHNVQRIFGGFLGAGPRQRVARLSALAESDGYRAVWDGADQKRHGTLRSIVTWIKHRTIRALIEARSDLLWLHAGAVANDGEVMFCLGQGGSGKSTLVVSLVDEGWSYLSDDVVAYDPVTGGALAFPLAPFYRVWGEEVVQDIKRLDKVRFETNPANVAAAALPVSTLTFPTFSPAGPASCEPRGPASVAVALADQLLNADTYRGDPLQACADLAVQARAYDLTHTPETPPIQLLKATQGL